MKENDFDIFVRNTLADAEEAVSPKVWAGVSKAIGKPHRVFPLWARWSSAAAVAAALVAGVFLFQPQQHSNSSISEAPLAQIIPSAVEEAPEPIQVLEEAASTPVVVKNAPVRFAQAPVMEAIASEPIMGVVRPVQEKLHAVAVSGMVNMQDAALLDKLIMSDNPAPKENVLSVTVSGNMQGTQRSEASPGPRRLFAAAGGLMPPMEEGITEGPETNFGLPFSVGLGVNFRLNSRWSIGTGVRYSFLSRTFAGRYIEDNIQTPATAIDNDQHWVGIPVNVYFNVLSQGRWRMHVFAGGAGEYMVDNHYLVHYSPNDIHYHKKEKAPIQWSGAAGIGAEFKLTPTVGIYLDPSVRYYFRTDLQPARSLRTIHPLMFDVEMGLRFSF